MIPVNPVERSTVGSSATIMSSCRAMSYIKVILQGVQLQSCHHVESPATLQVTLLRD